jgi:ABC-type transport system substrate-binding protein
MSVTSDNGITRRTFLSRGAITGGAVALGAAGLAACSSGGSGSGTSGGKAGIGTGSPVRGGSLTVGTIAEIDGFYPATNHWDTNGFLYANAIYDPLMAVAADGTVKPYLAETMTPNATYDIWTMTLRSGIKFSDGSALTATVVQANFFALDASVLTGPALKQIASVTTTDDLTVVYTLTAPNPTFPAGLTTQVGYVVGEAMIQAAGSSSSAAPKPIGTGPFTYSQWQPNDYFTAVRNPHYWRPGLPYLDSITFKPIPDTTQREATLRSGGVDMIESTDPGTINRFTNSGYQLVDSRTGVIGEPTMAFIMLNTDVSPTNDIRVRQALAKGLDVAVIQKIFGGGFAKPINGIFLPDSPFYSDTGYPTYDPSGAKTLVNEYKFEKGTPVVSLVTIPDPLEIKLVEILQQMWQKVGFKVNISEVEQATIIDDFVLGNFQAATSYQFGAVDPDLNYVWWSTTTLSPIGSIGLNFTRIDDPQIETNMLTGRHTADKADRIAAYKAVNERLAVDLPYLWIDQYLFSEVADSRVQNFDAWTFPDGTPGYGFDEGIFVPTQTWLAS